MLLICFLLLVPQGLIGQRGSQTVDLGSADPNAASPTPAQTIASGQNGKEARFLTGSATSGADGARREESLNKLAEGRAIVVQTHTWQSGGRSSAATNGPSTLLFKMTLTPVGDSEQPRGSGHLPKGNLVTAAYQSSAYRNYTVHISIAPQDVKLEIQPAYEPIGGSMRQVLTYRGELEFDAVILARDGAVVNSVATSVRIVLDDLRKTKEMVQSGIGVDQVIAVPSSGDFELRADVSDVRTGRHGVAKVAVGAALGMAGRTD
jgi:hypothetical protein